jgi:glycosyltransferase involved in cell wall biosynthesis
MKIGIDASALVKTQPTGVEVATRDLLAALIHQPAGDLNFVLYTPSPLGNEWTGYPHVAVKVLPTATGWTQRVLGPVASQDNLDLFWSPSYMLPVTFKGRGVVTVHGLEFIKFPASYSLKNWLLSYSTVLLAKFRAHHIIAVSQSVKTDLQTLLNIPADKISVVYNAVSPYLFQKIQTASRNSQTEPYILAVGRIESRKNTLSLIRAFAQIADSYPDVRLYLAGYISDSGYGHAVKQTIANFQLESRIQLLGHTNHAELGALYKNATAVAMVSLDEGFGIPVLEGFAADVPVITSKTSATAEVAGDAAILVDPQDINSIAAGLREVLDNPQTVVDLKRRGQLQLAKFNWDKSARALVEIFHRV